MTRLTPLVKDPLALSLGSRQGALIEDLYLRAHQDVLADVLGYALGDCFVLISAEPLLPLHLEDHIIPTVLSAFEVYLELTANLWNLR